MFDPWKVIKDHPHIIVEQREFQHLSGATNGVDRVYLDPLLLQVERRCTLTHELVHISRHHRSCQPAAVEAGVRLSAARLLIHVDDLAREMRWARHHDELAAELMVTGRVLSDRLGGLTESERRYLRLEDVDSVSV